MVAQFKQNKTTEDISNQMKDRTAKITTIKRQQEKGISKSLQLTVFTLPSKRGGLARRIELILVDENGDNARRKRMMRFDETKSTCE